MLKRKSWTKSPPAVPSKPNHSVILWKQYINQQEEQGHRRITMVLGCRRVNRHKWSLWAFHFQHKRSSLPKSNLDGQLLSDVLLMISPYLLRFKEVIWINWKTSYDKLYIMGSLVYRIIESLILEKTLKIIECNCWTSTTKSNVSLRRETEN